MYPPHVPPYLIEYLTGSSTGYLTGSSTGYVIGYLAERSQKDKYGFVKTFGKNKKPFM
jgi:membrane protein YqaA with SNARE-associated domain